MIGFLTTQRDFFFRNGHDSVKQDQVVYKYTICISNVDNIVSKYLNQLDVLL